MACGREMKDCVTGHTAERVELAAQGVARLNFRVLLPFSWFGARVCLARVLNACCSRATHGKANSAFTGRSVNTQKTCKL